MLLCQILSLYFLLLLSYGIFRVSSFTSLIAGKLGFLDVQRIQSKSIPSIQSIRPNDNVFVFTRSDAFVTGSLSSTDISMTMHLHNDNKQQEIDCSDQSRSVHEMNRRQLIASGIKRAVPALLTGCAAFGTVGLVDVKESVASGGATAGKYTTIPIAKRRYYGRVQQAVHEFLEMGPEIIVGDISKASKVQTFFDKNGVIVVAAKRKDVNGQCTQSSTAVDKACKGSEIRDSRYNDMKVSMYLLANAFRTDQQKPPDRLPTVRAAYAFFKQMDEIEKRIKKKLSKDLETQQLYATAYDILDKYLDLVELPPIDSGHYDQEFDTLVGESARIT